MKIHNKNKKEFAIMIFLVISLVFILPLNISVAYAAEAEASGNTVSRGEMQETCGLTPPMDVKGSLLLSIVMMCIPGILEKVMEWKEVKCEEVVCSYEAVVDSLDPSFCERQAQYKTCKYIVGEIFAIPPMAILEYLREKIADALANPVGMVYSTAVLSARATIKGSCELPIGCDVATNMPLGLAVPLVVFTDAASIIQQFQQMSENGFFPSFDDEGYCDEMEDIREELEEVVKYT